MAGKGTLLGNFFYSCKTQIWNNSNYVNYKHFVNMVGKIYENRLPRGIQVKKGWEPLLYRHRPPPPTPIPPPSPPPIPIWIVTGESDCDNHVLLWDEHISRIWRTKSWHPPGFLPEITCFFFPLCPTDNPILVCRILMLTSLSLKSIKSIISSSTVARRSTVTILKLPYKLQLHQILSNPVSFSYVFFSCPGLQERYLCYILFYFLLALFDFIWLVWFGLIGLIWFSVHRWCAHILLFFKHCFKLF